MVVKLLSYWDIPLAIGIIIGSIYLWYKYHIFCKKRDEEYYENYYKSEKKTPYSPIMHEIQSVWLILSLLILGSALFIKYRLNGTFPNIIEFIKELLSY